MKTKGLLPCTSPQLASPGAPTSARPSGIFRGISRCVHALPATQCVSQRPKLYTHRNEKPLFRETTCFAWGRGRTGPGLHLGGG